MHHWSYTAARWLFGLPAAVFRALTTRRRPAFALTVATAYPAGCVSDPIPLIPVRAVPLETLYQRKGSR